MPLTLSSTLGVRFRRLLVSTLLLTSAACGAEATIAPPAVPDRPTPSDGQDMEASPSTASSDASEPTLRLTGIPPVDDAVKARIGIYNDGRSAEASALSDDGKSLLISTRFAETAQVHVLRQPNGARRQLTFGDEPVRGATFVPGSSTSLLYVSDVGGNEVYQIFRLDIAEGVPTLLTDGTSRHGGFVFAHDGSRIAYTSNARNGKDMDLYLGDGRTAAAGKLLLERSGHWFPIGFSRDNRTLVAGQYISINDSRLHLIDLETKTAEQITPTDALASYRDAILHPDGKRLFLSSDREGEFVEIFEMTIADRKLKPLTKHIPWNVESMALSSDGGTLAFVTNEEGFGKLRLLDTQSGKEHAVRGIPPGLVEDIQFARNGSTLSLTLMGPTTNGDAYTLDTRTEKLTRWTESELGGLVGKALIEPTLIHFPTFDERKIPAFYYQPPGDGPHPVLVWIHGGPESQARPYFNPLLQYLVVESGIAVVVPNVRGSDGYGKSYLLLDNGFKREDSVRDIGALLDWIGTRPELDAKRTGVFGGSYGGYMVLASLVQFGDRIRAGVDVVGISNFVTFLKNTKAYRRDLRRAEYGDEQQPKMMEFLERISPSNNADKIKSALFVAHGKNDPRVPLSETDQIVREVNRSGKDVWYMVANNEGHGFRKKENRDMFAVLSAMFLERHLKVADTH